MVQVIPAGQPPALQVDQPRRRQRGLGPQHDDGFYVVAGVVRFTVGEKSFDAPSRTLVMIPPGAPHTFANTGDEPAVILNTFTPDLYVQYFRDLHDMVIAGRPVSDEAIEDVMARYATVPATEPAPGDVRGVRRDRRGGRARRGGHREGAGADRR